MKSFFESDTIRALGLVQEFLTFYCIGQRQWQRGGERERALPVPPFASLFDLVLFLGTSIV